MCFASPLLHEFGPPFPSSCYFCKTADLVRTGQPGDSRTIENTKLSQGLPSQNLLRRIQHAQPNSTSSLVERSLVSAGTLCARNTMHGQDPVLRGEQPLASSEFTPEAANLAECE